MNKIKFLFSFILIYHLFYFTEKYYNMEVKWFPDAISCETASFQKRDFQNSVYRQE